MKFRNRADDEAWFPRWGLLVGVDAEFDLTPEQAAGIVLQCRDDGRFEPVDDDAKQAVDEAFAALEEIEAGPPDESALKPEWVAYAGARGETNAAAMTKPQLIEKYGQTKETR